MQESAGEGMMDVDGEGIRKKARPGPSLFRGDPDSTAQSMINANTELRPNPIIRVDYQNFGGNLFAKVAQYQAQTFSDIVAAEQEQVPVAEQEAPQAEMEIDNEENLVASSSNAQIDGQHQETTSSQSLALPTQSFVRDTYDSTNGGSTAMSVDQDESAGMPLPPGANDRKGVQGTGDSAKMDATTGFVAPAHMPRGSSPEQDMILRAPRQETVAQSTTEGSSVSDVQDEVDKTHVDNLAPNRSDDTAGAGASPSREQPSSQAQSLRKSQQANSASNGSEGAAVATPSREVPLVHPQPPPRTVNMMIMQREENVEPHSLFRPITTALDQSNERPSRPRTAEPQVTEPAVDAYTPKRIVHRSTSSSRAGRILSSRTASKEQLSGQVDNAAAPVERAILTAKGTIVQDDRRTLDDASDENGVARTAQAQEHSSRSGTDGANATLAGGCKQNHPYGPQAKDPQSIRTEDQALCTDSSKTASKSRRSQGGDLTGNARFQQMIQQSSRRGRMVADQLAAARAAALPPVDLQPMRDAINPPFVNASKAEKEALLTRFLSRSSSPSNARAMKNHPRAEAVQERHSQHRFPKTPQLPLQAFRLQSSGSGTQDEQLAMDLILRAKNREAEIIKLKQEIEMLEQQNASLEKLNADLVEKKAAACKENEAILLKKKDAILMARKLIAASQNVSVIGSVLNFPILIRFILSQRRCMSTRPRSSPEVLRESCGRSVVDEKRP